MILYQLRDGNTVSKHETALPAPKTHFSYLPANSMKRIHLLAAWAEALAAFA